MPIESKQIHSYKTRRVYHHLHQQSVHDGEQHQHQHQPINNQHSKQSGFGQWIESDIWSVSVFWVLFWPLCLYSYFCSSSFDSSIKIIKYYFVYQLSSNYLMYQLLCASIIVFVNYCMYQLFDISIIRYTNYSIHQLLSFLSLMIILEINCFIIRNWNIKCLLCNNFNWYYITRGQNRPNCWLHVSL